MAAAAAEACPDAFEGHLVLFGDTMVGRHFGPPDGAVGHPSAGPANLSFAPPEARLPFARFYEDEGFIWPAELLRHVEVGGSQWEVSAVDIFALHRLAVSAAAQAGRPLKRRKRAPKFEAACATVETEFGRVCKNVKAAGREACTGATVAGLADFRPAHALGCRVKGCASSQADRGLCERHRTNGLKKKFDLELVSRSVATNFSRREVERLRRPEFVLGFIGLHGSYFGAPRAHAVKWADAEDRGRWLASGGILDDEPRILANLHPTVATGDICDLYRVLLPDGKFTQHALDAADARADFYRAFPTSEQREDAWPKLQRYGVHCSFWLRVARMALDRLEKATVHVHGPEASAIDDCSCTVDARRGFLDFEAMETEVAVINSEYLSWGMLFYILGRATVVHATGDRSKASGFVDTDRERFLGEPWNAVLKCAPKCT